MEQQTVIFVIGMSCHGKSTFISEHFRPDETYKDFVYLDLLDYEKANKNIPNGSIKAYYDLRNVIEDTAKQGKSMIVEHTMFKRSRRMDHLRILRNINPDIRTVVYYVESSDDIICRNFDKRNIPYNKKEQVEQKEFFDSISPADGFDQMFLVYNDKDGFHIHNIQSGISG